MDYSREILKAYFEMTDAELDKELASLSPAEQAELFYQAEKELVPYD